jgi:peptide deformylase
MYQNIKLITYPNKKLYQKSEKVKDPTDPEIQGLIKKMIEIMRQEKGVGISAIQVNVPLAIIVIEDENHQFILINPRIYKKSWQKDVDNEGCLSVPGIFGPVKRNKSIQISGLNEKGERINIKANGLLARVIQHEYDHTRGILFIDRLIDSEESRKIREKLRDLDISNS